DARMWADACAAMERAERLRRQFFHHGTPHWEAPIDVFETDDALTILIALPGVELDDITVALNAGTLTVKGERPLPRELQNALILITTRNLVLFPGVVLPMTLGRQRSVVAAQTAIRLNRPVGLVLQREAAHDDPMPVDLHRVGTEANLLRYVTSPDGGHHVIC